MSRQDAERWIVIPSWEKFQHYKNRDPFWIKNYVRLIQDDNYTDLTLDARGLLHGLWLMRARSRGPIRESTVKRVLHGGAIGRASGNQRRHIGRHLEALNHAGFIELTSIRPLETETETENRTTAGNSTAKKAGMDEAEVFGNIVARPLLALAGDNGYGLHGAVLELLACLRDRDDGTEGVVWNVVKKGGLAEGDVRRAIEAAKGPGVKSPTKVAISELQKAMRAA